MSGALVVLVEKVDGVERSAALYLSAETCLSQIARLAERIDSAIRIALFCGHTEWKWTGRGQR